MGSAVYGVLSYSLYVIDAIDGLITLSWGMAVGIQLAGTITLFCFHELILGISTTIGLEEYCKISGIFILCNFKQFLSNIPYLSISR